MKITTEINDYSEPAKPPICIHNHWNIGKFVELEVNGERYTLIVACIVEWCWLIDLLAKISDKQN